jgi:hypothetical protein
MTRKRVHQQPANFILLDIHQAMIIPPIRLPPQPALFLESGRERKGEEMLLGVARNRIITLK